MADCSQFPFGSIGCTTIQVLEPDRDIPVALVPPPGFDPAYTEEGDVILSPGQTIVNVTFQAVKAGDYRFEYLYIDDLGATNPGSIAVVPVIQTVYGFQVDLAGFGVPTDGCVLHWRVAVISSTAGPIGGIDSPESLYVQLPMASSAVITFVNPRSDTDYGFSELRIENLTDTGGQISGSPVPEPRGLVLVSAMVIAKTTLNFTVQLSPTPPTNNYYIAVRTP